MEKEIPKIYFNHDHLLQIEVMDFAELFEKLRQSNSHNPFAVHKIEFYMILVLTQKPYTHFVDFNSYQLVEGSALFVAKNQVHYFNKVGLQSDGFCIVFSKSFMDKYFFLSESHKFSRLFNYHIESPIIHQAEMGDDSFVDIAQKLHQEYKHPNDFAKPEMLLTLLHFLFLKAERAKEYQAISGVNPHWLEIFSAFKDLLEKEYVKTRSSRAYAAELLISYKFLNDIVKKLTGKTVKAFIDEFVTMEIQRYLVSTSLSVKEISYQTGFDEPANMVKFFKKNTHTTPLKFRQQS